MNILFVSTAFKPAWETGGTTRVCYDLARRLTENGHNVTVLTTNRGSAKHKVKTGHPIDVDGIRVYYFKNMSKALERKKVITPVGVLSTLQDGIGDYDIVHLHEHRSLLHLLVAWWSIKNNIPYIIEGHGSIGTNRGNRKLKRIFDVLFGDHILHRSDAVVAISQAEEKEFKEFGINSENIYRVPNGVDARNSLSIQEKDLQSINTSCDKSIILFLGRINRIKGIDTLVEAFKYLNSDEYILLIAGPDEGYLSKLESLTQELGLEDSVNYIGEVYGDEKTNLYSNSDLFVLPSRYEVFGNTIFEAGLSDTPILVSDSCDISGELIEKGAVEVFSRDPKELADKIRFVSTNLEKKNRLVYNMNEAIENTYSWSVVLDSYISLYKNMISY